MIPVNTPIIRDKESEYIQECLNTGWISSEGKFVADFEDKFSKYNNRNYGIAVSNGSAALDIAIKALDIVQGDEVIVPTFTIISPVQSIVSVGATPILVDCDPYTWNMDVNQIESKISPRTKAIIAVHIYGLPIDMEPLLNICEKYNLLLIEDAAEVIGQEYKNRKCGSFGVLSTFSFYPNKHITTGEGGMIVCNDKELAERCRRLRNLAFEPGRRFIHQEIGWNYRMTNLQAAIGCAQLENIQSNIELKRKIGQKYHNAFKHFKSIQIPIHKTSFAENIYWVFGIVCENKGQYEGLIKALDRNNIGHRPFFWCMHEQPVFIKQGFFSNESFPNSERIARHGLYLPSGLGLRDEEIETVIQVVSSFLESSEI